jgi:hypothetical protein
LYLGEEVPIYRTFFDNLPYHQVFIFKEIEFKSATRLEIKAIQGYLSLD